MCGSNIISAIKLRGAGGLSVTDKIYRRYPQRKIHHLEVLTLDLTDMACRPVDSSDLDQDWKKKRTPVRRKENCWSENVYCIY
jgi:hypothetical protein